jgi:hypothetical protein
MNDTEIPGPPSGTPYPEVQPIGADERHRLTAEYFGEHVGPATGWYTVPGFVRVAVWLWALVTVLSFAAGLLFSLVWVIILMVTLGAQ